jgi:hypothetical protein
VVSQEVSDRYLQPAEIQAIQFVGLPEMDVLMMSFYSDLSRVAILSSMDVMTTGRTWLTMVWECNP